MAESRITLTYEDGRIAHVRKHMTSDGDGAMTAATGFPRDTIGAFVSVDFGDDFDVFVTPTAAVNLAGKILRAAREADPGLAPIIDRYLPHTNGAAPDPVTDVEVSHA